MKREFGVEEVRSLAETEQGVWRDEARSSAEMKRGVRQRQSEEFGGV